MPFTSFVSRFFTRSFGLSPAMSVVPEGTGASAAAAATTLPEGAQLCTVAAGCFWGTEHLYRRHFAGKGLLDAKVGYIGGDLTDPSYRAVCGGKTGREFSSRNPLVFSQGSLTESSTQTPKPRKSSLTPSRSRTASSSSSSTSSTTPPRSTPRARTRDLSTAPPSTTTTPSRKRRRAR